MDESAMASYSEPVIREEGMGCMHNFLEAWIYLGGNIIYIHKMVHGSSSRSM